jgi:inosine/xanthosine triphosphatase
MKQNLHIPQVVAVGSTNKTKVEAVQHAVAHHHVRVIAYAARSQATHQPLSEEETREGALSRANDCLLNTEAELGFGLEAGVFFVNDEVYLCQWGALADRNENVYFSNGPVIMMPQVFKEELLAGDSLETIMHRHTGIEDLGKKEGAVGIFTHSLVTRTQTMTTIAQVLWGQYLYYSNLPCPSIS